MMPASPSRSPLATSRGLLGRCFLIAAACFALVVCGCARESWLDETRELSETATAAEARGDDSAARRALTEIAEARYMSDSERRSARPYRQDAYYRLARISNAPAEQLEFAEAGLALVAHAPESALDLFTANLLVVKGRALEAMGDDSLAADAYHDALLINEALLDEVLDDPSDHPSDQGESTGQ